MALYFSRSCHSAILRVRSHHMETPLVGNGLHGTSLLICRSRQIDGERDCLLTTVSVTKRRAGLLSDTEDNQSMNHGNVRAPVPVQHVALQQSGWTWFTFTCSHSSQITITSITIFTGSIVSNLSELLDFYLMTSAWSRGLFN